MQTKFGPESVWVYQVLRSVPSCRLVFLHDFTSEVKFDNLTEVWIPQKVRGMINSMNASEAQGFSG